MSCIKFSPDELNIIWEYIKILTTGNTRLFVIINIDLDLYQWPRSLPTSYLWAIGPPRKQGFYFCLVQKFMTQMTKIELKKIIQIPIKINRHKKWAPGCNYRGSHHPVGWFTPWTISDCVNLGKYILDKSKDFLSRKFDSKILNFLPKGW